MGIGKLVTLPGIAAGSALDVARTDRRDFRDCGSADERGWHAQCSLSGVSDGQPASPRADHGQDIRDRAFSFACRVVLFGRDLRAQGGIGSLMVGQLINCSGSVAAMLEEARAAESTPDFVSKASIALKEAREAWVRLRICERTECGPRQEAMALVEEANQIVAILTTILRRTRENARSARTS